MPFLVGHFFSPTISARAARVGVEGSLDDVLRQFHQSGDITAENTRLANAGKLQFGTDKQSPAQPKKTKQVGGC